MNLINSQISYSATVSPQGDIAPAWQAFLQRTVDSESYREWCRSIDNGIGFTIPEDHKRFSLRKAIRGVLP